MRIVRVKVLHAGTFASLLGAALYAKRCYQHRGHAYRRIAGTSKAGVYCRSSYGLRWMQERVEEYESRLFQQLLSGCCGRDGVIRPRTHLWQGANGTYQQAGASRSAAA